MLETIKGKYTIKQIFKDNWNGFLVKRENIRPVVLKEVERILACKDKDKLGWNMYQCPKCNRKHYVAHTRKSRFCNSCGKVMTDNWIAKRGKQSLYFNHSFVQSDLVCLDWRKAR